MALKTAQIEVFIVENALTFVALRPTIDTVGMGIVFCLDLHGCDFYFCASIV